MSADSLTLAQRWALQDLYADYAAALSNNEFERWPAFFIEDCVYQVQPRENYDKGLPLATIAYESRRMLEDRVYGVRNTLYHQPYYQRVVLGPVRVLVVRAKTGTPTEVRNTAHSAAQTEVDCECNYAVFRTKANHLSEVFSVGRYIDTVSLSEDAQQKGIFRALFCVKRTIFDSELIPNSLIYPI
jgi:salicylate 5-hydroxylase small subunit